MKRKISLAMALGAALVLGAASLTPTGAASKPHIEDPEGDANFVNDQGTGDGSFGDQTAATVGTVSDILAVTFSNDAKNVYVAIETVAAPPATTGVGFRVRTNPDGPGGVHCLNFEIRYPGANNTLAAAEGHLRDACTGEVIEGEVLPSIGVLLAIPRSAHEALGKGGALTAPQAQSYMWIGSNYPAGAAAGTIDTTKVGTDFKLVDKKAKKKKK